MMLLFILVEDFKNTERTEESKVKSDTIRGHRRNNIYNPIFEPTLTPEQIAMIDEACKPFIIQNHKPNIGDAILYVSSAYRKEVTKWRNQSLRWYLM